MVKEKLEKMACGTRRVSVEDALADVKRNISLHAFNADARLRDFDAVSLKSVTS